MLAISCRRRLATSCALALALVASVACQPAFAQRDAEPGAWQVAESVTIETDGFAPRLSPDGRWVAGLKDLDERQLCIWRVSTGEERCNGESSRVADASIAWSPDSRQVAFSQNGAELDSDIFVLDAPPGEVIAAPPRFSPDGTAMVYGVTADETTSRDATILVQDLESGAVIAAVDGVSLQLWEGVTGNQWTANDQLVLPLDNGAFEVVTLERA